MPARQQCNLQTFDDLSVQQGYYPVFIGVSNVFEETEILEKFKSDAPELKKHFQPKEEVPKLCGSLSAMLPINYVVALSKKVSLVQVFNFMYNEDRVPSNFSPSRSTDCRNIKETETSLEAKFKSAAVHFDKTEDHVKDVDGFLEVTLSRSDPEEKGIALIETIYQSADSTDFVPFKGPAVFLQNENHTSFFMRLKMDNDTETETFAFKIKPSSSRVKRVTEPENRSLKISVLAALGNTFSFCRSIPGRFANLFSRMGATSQEIQGSSLDGERVEEDVIEQTKTSDDVTQAEEQRRREAEEEAEEEAQAQAEEERVQARIDAEIAEQKGLWQKHCENIHEIERQHYI